MRINKLEIKDFGKFTGDKIIDNIDDKIALFYGENEAGKTTLFNLIKTLIYGFYPATADSHPYTPWDKGQIEFTAHLLNGSQDNIIVNRRLLSTPKGQYIIGDNQINIRNKTLPWAEHISQEIFEKIYSLRVEDLVEIQGKAWDEVEDKLLANYGTEVIRSSREVLKDIKKKCDEIWRENNRGNFLVKKIQEEIKTLKKEKKNIYDREYEIRVLDQKINHLNAESDKLNKDALKTKAFLKESKELKPIKEILNEINELEGKLINEDISKSLPQNIREKLSELEASLQELNREEKNKEQLLEERKREIFNFTNNDITLIENKWNIEVLIEESKKVKQLNDRLQGLNYDINKLKDRLAFEGSNILSKEWNEDIRESFESLKKSDIKILVNKYRDSLEKLKEVNWKKDFKTKSEIKVKLSKGYLFSLLLSFIVIIGGYILDSGLVKMIGMGCLFYGFTGIINYYSLKKGLVKSSKSSKESDTLQDQIKRINEEVKKNKEGLVKNFKGIPISNITIDNMDEMFLPSVFRIIEILYDLREKEIEFSKTREDYELGIDNLKGFLSQFTFEGFVSDQEKIYILKGRLEELEKKDLLNKELEKDIKKIEEEIDIIRDKSSELNKVKIQYSDSLKEIDVDIDNGLTRVEQNYIIRNRIEGLREKLNSWSNIDYLIKEIEKSQKDNWQFTEYEITKAEDDLDTLNKKIREIEVEKARCEERLNQLNEHITLDEIESKILYLEDNLLNLCQKRDRLALLSEIIKYSDERFKEDNQPDVLKNASRYFNIMTGGKYTDIYIEENDEEMQIMVRKKDDILAKRVVDTFSKGTLNQLYLSLRLSLVDHLDNNQETLPISFDELLVNWDGNRIENSLELLDEISKYRQIFIFTCHEWMAEKIERHFSIKRKIL